MALGALAFALGIAATPASASSTSGWSQADVSAGKIREFQTRLMVAALRCRAAGFDILASYNQFIAADRAELTAANTQLKAHFMAAGAIAGQRDYDRYTTALANSYGAAPSGPGSCERAGRLAQEAAAAKGNLLAVAERDTEVADASPMASPSPAADRWPSPQAYSDRGPPPSYDDQAPPRGYGDEWQSRQAYNDQPPPGYYDQGPPRRYRDDWQSQQAYNDQPPPGYYDQGPPPGYDDRPPSRDYGGY